MVSPIEGGASKITTSKPFASAVEPLGEPERPARIGGDRDRELGHLLVRGQRRSAAAPRSAGSPRSSATPGSTSRWNTFGATARTSTPSDLPAWPWVSRSTSSTSPPLLGREVRGDVDREGGLAGPTLLVDEGDLPHRLLLRDQLVDLALDARRAASRARRPSRAGSRRRRSTAGSSPRARCAGSCRACPWPRATGDDRLDRRDELLVREQLLGDLADALLAGLDELLHHGLSLSMAAGGDLATRAWVSRAAHAPLTPCTRIPTVRAPYGRAPRQPAADRLGQGRRRQEHASPRRSRSPPRARGPAHPGLRGEHQGAHRRAARPRPRSARRSARLDENLWAVDVRPEEAMREYALMMLKFESVYNAVFENRLVRYFLRFVAVAPGAGAAREDPLPPAGEAARRELALRPDHRRRARHRPRASPSSRCRRR